MPLYLLSVKDVLSVKIFRKALNAFCWGVIVFNIMKFFCLTGTLFFVEPTSAFSFVYDTRFGGNMNLLGGFVYLEPQAVYICVSALISYFLFLTYSKDRKMCWGKVNNLLVLILSILFLSFTVTKGAILAFVLAFSFLSIVYFRKKPLKFKLFFLGFIVVGLLCGYCFLPQAYVQRLESMKQEIENLQDGNFKGSSVAARWGLMKENFEHINQFGLWGLGFYKSAITEEWYENSSYKLKGIHNAHNTFVEYWLSGGIWGLIFILYYFVKPLLEMQRRKQFVYLPMAIIITLFIAANTCVIANLEDSLPVVVCMLAMFYLYIPLFWKLQIGINSEV